ncbi:hypothetical protein E2562_032205, partial [Oryza meyeriana var. granulata]
LVFGRWLRMRPDRLEKIMFSNATRDLFRLLHRRGRPVPLAWAAAGVAGVGCAMLSLLPTDDNALQPQWEPCRQRGSGCRGHGQPARGLPSRQDQFHDFWCSMVEEEAGCLEEDVGPCGRGGFSEATGNEGEPEKTGIRFGAALNPRDVPEDQIDGRNQSSTLAGSSTRSDHAAAPENGENQNFGAPVLGLHFSMLPPTFSSC